MLILKSEEMFRDADRVANQVFEFLELSAYRPPVEGAATAANPRRTIEPELREQLQAFFAADQKLLQALY